MQSVILCYFYNSSIGLNNTHDSPYKTYLDLPDRLVSKHLADHLKAGAMQTCTFRVIDHGAIAFKCGLKYRFYYVIYVLSTLFL